MCFSVPIDFMYVLSCSCNNTVNYDLQSTVYMYIHIVKLISVMSVVIPLERAYLYCNPAIM